MWTGRGHSCLQDAMGMLGIPVMAPKKFITAERSRTTLECVHEQSNTVDRYAVAILKDYTIIGHLLKTSTRIYSFLRRGDVIYTVSRCRKEKVFKFSSRYKFFAR